MSADRDLILGRVRDALAPLPQRAALPDWDGELVLLREARAVTDAWALFAERLLAVHGVPLTAAGDLVALLAENDWTHGTCDPTLWPTLAPHFPTDFTVETTFERSRVDEYQFGITRAVGAIAETGTIILDDRTSFSRLAALAPWVHVALVDPETIFHDLTQAVAALGADPNVIWCTGPSKTADVEGILIEGVHGPGVQVALRLSL